MGYRLPASLQADLSWIWNDCEVAMGVRSSLGWQIAQLERSAPPDKPMPADAARSPGIRLALAVTSTHQERRQERWDAADERIRLYWEPLAVHEDQATKPAEFLGSSRDHERASRIDRTIRTLIKSPNGIANQRILFVVYGNPSYALVADDLSRLEVFSIVRSEREAMLAGASRAYAAAHDEVADAARDTRRARLDRLLGAVGT